MGDWILSIDETGICLPRQDEAAAYRRDPPDIALAGLILNTSIDGADPRELGRAISREISWVPWPHHANRANILSSYAVWHAAARCLLTQPGLARRLQLTLEPDEDLDAIVASFARDKPSEAQLLFSQQLERVLDEREVEVGAMHRLDGFLAQKEQDILAERQRETRSRMQSIFSGLQRTSLEKGVCAILTLCGEETPHATYDHGTPPTEQVRYQTMLRALIRRAIRILLEHPGEHTLRVCPAGLHIWHNGWCRPLHQRELLAFQREAAASLVDDNYQVDLSNVTQVVIEHPGGVGRLSLESGWVENYRSTESGGLVLADFAANQTHRKALNCINSLQSVTDRLRARLCIYGQSSLPLFVRFHEHMIRGSFITSAGHAGETQLAHGTHRRWSAEQQASWPV